MQTSIIDFVLKEHIDPVVPTDVEVVNSSAQTGDSIFFVIALLLLFAAGILAYLNYKKFFSWNPSVEGAKHALVIEPSSLKTVYIAAATIFACAICVMCLGFSQKAIADQTKVPNDEPQHVKAYVDENTGEVTFDTSKLINTSGAMIHLDNLIVSKNEGIEDGNCTWTFTYQDNVLYNDEADGKKHAVKKPIDIAAGASCDIELGSTIDSDIAISLIGKSVLTVTYELNPGNILSWEEGSHISQVTDSKGNDIPNGSRVVEKTQLTVHITNVSTLNYVFTIKDATSQTSKDLRTKYNAEFVMPSSNTEISVIETQEEFYIKHGPNDSGNIELSFYYGLAPSENSVSNEVVIYRQADLNLDDPVAEDWPYWGDGETVRNIHTVIIDPSVSKFYGLHSTAAMFAGQTGVKFFSGFQYLQTENVVDMSNMFENFYNDGTYSYLIPDVSGWDTSKVKYFTGMFYDFAYRNTNMDSVPDVSKWDTSSAIDMSQMFEGYAFDSSILTKVPDVSNWDVSKVTTIYLMFYWYNGNGKALNEVPNVKEWKTSSVKDMSYAFAYYNRSTNEIKGSILSKVPDVSGWDTSQVTTMDGMFEFYAEFSKSLHVMPDLSGWKTPSLVSAEEMFQHYGFESGPSGRTLDLSSFNTSSLNKYHNMIFVWTDKIIIGENWKISLDDAGIISLDPGEYFLINGQIKCGTEEELDAAIFSWMGEYPIIITRKFD